jgi:DNA polymerase III subunit epsilon
MSARRRFWLLFALLALVGAGLVAAGLWLTSSGLAPAGLVWPGVLLGLLAVHAVVWLALDRIWLGPSTALAREIQLLTHANAARPLTVPAGRRLGPLWDAVVALAEQWRRSRAEHDLALAEALAKARQQQNRLEAVLRDLSDGLIACSADRRILLVNDAALRILGGVPELGLDRPLDALVAREPIGHAFESLRERLREEGPPTAGSREEFVCATADGGRLLRCRMALILEPDGDASGFVLDFADATERLGRIEEREARVVRQIEELRAPVAALRAAAEVLEHPASIGPARRTALLEVLRHESVALSERLEGLCRSAEGLARGDWPMADLLSVDLVRAVDRRLAEAPGGPRLTAVGPGLWLHGDGYHLCTVLERLARRVHEATRRAELDLEARSRGRRVELDLAWQGEPLPVGTVERWLEEPVDTATGPYRLRDVLARHGSELWSQAHARPGHALLRLPLPPPDRPQLGERPRRKALPPRPEFYDFELLERTAARAAPLLERPLGELGYVVFDTETTGLRPDAGDRIVQIAAVRIVNRRLLSGETFDALVDPRRPIPKASTRFHGITQTMVHGRPPIEIVLPQFHKYLGDAVLVAHNADFDLAFLRPEEERLGLRFDHPLLDTLLISAALHDHLPAHSLDDIAARFGIVLIDRHKALGDAIGTAQLFLRMLDLLEARGVRKLGEALALTGRIADLRRRRAQEFGDRRAQSA